MASERVGDMTLDELKALIQDEVKQYRRGIPTLDGKPSVQEVLDDIDEHMWTPPPGTPTNQELVRADRDRVAEDIRRVPKPTSLMEQAQKLLSLVVGLGALLTIGGFWIVNTYLAQLTSIQTYQIHSNQILAAGFWFMIFATIPATILALTSYSIFKYLPAILDALISLVTKHLFRSNYAVNPKSKSPFSKLEQFFIVGWILTFLIFSFPNSFASEFYKTIPRYLGGGSPIPIILVFKNSEAPELLNLTPEKKDSPRTQSLVLLAELTNGLLVYDPQTERIAAVNNDDLLGRLEQNHRPISEMPYSITLSTSTP